MPAAMIERLIVHKLRKADAHRRPLTHEILQTARHIQESSTSRSRATSEWAGELARMAAETLSLPDVVYYLSPSPNTIAEPDVELNRLVSGVAVDGHLPETYFHLITSQKDIRTRYFGNLLSAAVRGGQTVLRNILQTLPRPSTKLDEQIRSFHLGAALTVAVELGNVEAVRILLGEEAESPGWQSRYEQATMPRAFELGDLPCTQVLYEERDLKNKAEFEKTADDALRFAVQNGHETLVRLVAGDQLGRKKMRHLRGATLEDACHARSTGMVDFFLNGASSQFITVCGPTWNSLYWAGRSGDVDILRSMLQTFVRDADRHLRAFSMRWLGRPSTA